MEKGKLNMNGRTEHQQQGNDHVNRMLEGLPYYIKEWNENMVADGLTASTRKTYIHTIRKFLRTFDGDIEDIDYNEITIPKITSYINSNKYDDKGNERSDAHQLLIYNVLNSFFEYMIFADYLDKNPMKKLKRPKNNDLARIQANRGRITTFDFKKIILHMDDVAKNPFYLARDKVILLLMMTTGIRKTALTEINMEDIDFDNATIFIYDKGEKPRACHISDSLREAIDDYLPLREEIVVPDCNALFVNWNGQHKGKRITGKVVD